MGVAEIDGISEVSADGIPELTAKGIPELTASGTPEITVFAAATDDAGALDAQPTELPSRI